MHDPIYSIIDLYQRMTAIQDAAYEAQGEGGDSPEWLAASAARGVAWDVLLDTTPLTWNGYVAKVRVILAEDCFEFDHAEMFRHLADEFERMKALGPFIQAVFPQLVMRPKLRLGQYAA
jgi:hypothetical protein